MGYRDYLQVRGPVHCCLTGCTVHAAPVRPACVLGGPPSLIVVVTCNHIPLSSLPAPPLPRPAVAAAAAAGQPGEPDIRDV